jgi:hypothetical protein
MAERILIEDFHKKKAIELTDGTVLDLPERTAEIYEKIVDLEKKREKLSEYDYCREALEILYGKDGFKKIAPDGKKTNLDYLEKVQLVSLNLFMAEKIEAEREEMEKRVESLAPLTDKLKAINPIISKIK